MKVEQVVIIEMNSGLLDAIGVLDDGRVFWAWAQEMDIESIHDFVKRYAENPDECTAEQGAEVHGSIEELRDALAAADREDLLPLTEEPAFVVEGSVGPGSRWEKRATLTECVEMVRAKRGA